MMLYFTALLTPLDVCRHGLSALSAGKPESGSRENLAQALEIDELGSAPHVGLLLSCS